MLFPPSKNLYQVRIPLRKPNNLGPEGQPPPLLHKYKDEKTNNGSRRATTEMAVDKNDGGIS